MLLLAFVAFFALVVAWLVAPTGTPKPAATAAIESAPTGVPTLAPREAAA